MASTIDLKDRRGCSLASTTLNLYASKLLAKACFNAAA
jgi:hypothetical protein